VNLPQMDAKSRAKKDQISKFKKRADEFNKSLYSDIGSFKKGLFIILIVASIVFLYFFFSNQ